MAETCEWLALSVQRTANGSAHAMCAAALQASAAVDGLLHRLYSPILFRALQAANGAVRLNALHLLVDAFPLQVRFNWVLLGLLQCRCV